MPPLTVTSEEIHRIVHTLTEAIDEVTLDGRGTAQPRAVG